ncbi:hypothetical protein PY254_11675 [Rhodanobacter sp. AS-Z3]|uniref:DUF6988 family protein n=1 Tax=Rhodanobacter sp. AS-Z3 TaxID=3031330 RepID=UPI00247B1C90|nr:hypothetical protein [Rhodanobacter sp. AS-Z3]WEN13899.1 hypothetical protein PY254_11675 [Rhodanobacter sp. AS-Z3]
MSNTDIQARAIQVRQSLETSGNAVSKIRIPAGVPDKVRASLALLRASFDDATGIVELFRIHGGEFAGACFSLLRPMNEKLKRGTWIAFCATDAEVQDFIQNDKIPQRNLSQEIEQIPPFDQFPMFSQQHANAWDKFHSFTHGGNQVLGAYTSGEGIGASFGDQAILGVLDHVESIVVMGAQVMAMIAGNYVPDQAHGVLDELTAAFMPNRTAPAS